MLPFICQSNATASTALHTCTSKPKLSSSAGGIGKTFDTSIKPDGFSKKTDLLSVTNVPSSTKDRYARRKALHGNSSSTNAE